MAHVVDVELLAGQQVMFGEVGERRKLDSQFISMLILRILHS
jgi:hypothetical protein